MNLVLNLRRTRHEISISILILLLFCAVCLFFFSIIATPKSGQVVNISENWNLHTDEGIHEVQIGILGKKIVDEVPNGPLHLTKSLEYVEGLNTLLFSGNHQNIRVVLDEDVLFESPQSKWKNPGIGLHLISLPTDYGEKTLHLFIQSPYAYQSMTTRPVYLGNTTSLYAFILAEAFPNLFYLFVCLITGFFLIGYSFYSFLHRALQADKLALGIFSVLYGLCCIAWDPIMCLLFSPFQVSIISAELHFFYLIPFFTYLRLNYTMAKKLTLGILIVFCSLVGILHVLLFFSIIDYPYGVILFNSVLYAVFLPMVVIAFFELKHKNPLLLFISPSLLFFLVGAIGTVFEFFGKVRFKADAYYALAIFVFICFNWIYNLKQIYNQRIQEKRELKTLETKNVLIASRYDEMRSHLHKTREIRHEINHHLAAIRFLCTEGNITRIEEYVSDISSGMLTKDISYSSNTLVDCILSNYAMRSKDLGIQFDYQAHLPKSLPFPDADICSLLLNMLDNAIDANVNTTKKWIRLHIQYKNNLLIITCQNTHCNRIEERNGRILTHKTDKENHGYGISIMKSITEKYGNTLLISYNTECFSIKVILQY